MNPRERLLATLRGKTADRVPLQVLGFDFGKRENIANWGNSARREIAERIFGYTINTFSVPSHINRYLVTPPQRIRVVAREQEKNGVTTINEIDTPKGKLRAITTRNNVSSTTWTIKYPVEDTEDIAKIRSIPWERPKNLSPFDVDTLPADAEGRRIIFTRISSPFVCVAGMMKYEYFLTLCATELNLMKELTEECKVRILDVLDVLFTEPGIEVVWMGGCEWLTPPMGSPRLYEKLVQDSEREIISRIHRAGALVHIHCHGNVRTTIQSVIARGADYFEPVEPPPDGDITFAEAKSIANGKMTLGGNIESRILECEGEEEVEKATRAAFDGGKQRMVLQTTEGPLTPMNAQILANYHRMIDVWEELSAID